jgi:hypothetical protein
MHRDRNQPWFTASIAVNFVLRASFPIDQDVNAIESALRGAGLIINTDSRDML